MSPSTSGIVTDRDGVRGVVETTLPQEAGRESQTLVRLGDGRQVVVPSDALVLRDDGSYELPFSLIDLERSAPGGQTGDAVVIPLIAEELDVHKRVVETGGVRIRKTVHERQETFDEPLFREQVDVQRVTVNRVVDGPVPVRQEGDTMVVPLYEEVLVVQKQLMLKEELRITRQRIETHEPQTVTLRREEAMVERIDSQGQREGDNADQTSVVSS